MTTESRKVSTTMKASIENVWHAYTSPDAIVKWNASALMPGIGILLPAR